MSEPAAANPTRSTGAQLAWGWQHVHPYRWSLVGVALLATVGTGAGLLYPLLIMELWDRVLTAPHDVSQLPWILGSLGGLAFVSFGLGVLSAWLYTNLSARALVRMRLGTLRQLLLQPASFFAGAPVGDLHSRLSGDVADLQGFLVDVPIALWRNLIVLLGSLFIMAYLSWQLLLLAIVPVPIAVWIVHLLRERVTRASRQVRDRNGEISSVIVESLTGASFLRAGGLENRQSRRFLDRGRRLVGDVVRLEMLAALTGGSPEVILRLGSLALFAAGAYLARDGNISEGGLIAVGLYQAGLFRPVSATLGMLVRFHQARASMARVFEVVDRVSEVPETGTKRLAQVRGELRLEGVSFAYPGAPGELVLDGADLHVPAGSTVAIVGESGAGKSTLLGLLLRTQDPTAGKVSVDGVDLRDVRRSSFLRHVGVVTQDTFLLHDTLRANLLCLRPRAPEDELERAVEIADLAGLVDRLPDGLETIVGERGARLSGGERQRVAIARALLRDPQILVLDEATSSLDWDSDRRVREGIARLMEGRTTVLVTHRLDTVTEVDQLVKLQDGRLEPVEDPGARVARDVASDVAAPAPAPARVAILDSGVLAGHPHVGALAGGTSCTGRPGDDWAVDRVGHGTPVAAIVRWLAPDAELYSVKVFDRDLRGSATRVAAGLRWAIEHEMDVACLALGTTAAEEGLEDLERACEEAHAAGVIVVAAARGDAPSYPALWPNVLGCLRDERLDDDEIAYRPDAPLPFAAAGRPRPIPGVPPPLNLSGPSFAAPRLAAHVARLRAANPTLDFDAVQRELIRQAVTPGAE